MPWKTIQLPKITIPNISLMQDACGMANCKRHKVQTQHGLFCACGGDIQQILHRTICISEAVLPECLVLGDDQGSHHSTRAAISTNCQCSCLLHEPQGCQVVKDPKLSSCCHHCEVSETHGAFQWPNLNLE